MQTFNLFSDVSVDEVESFVSEGIKCVEGLFISGIQYLQSFEHLLLSRCSQNSNLLSQLSKKITSYLYAEKNLLFLQNLKMELRVNQSLIKIDKMLDNHSKHFAYQAPLDNNAIKSRCNDIITSMLLQTVKVLDPMYNNFNTEKELNQFKQIMQEFRQNGKDSALRLCLSPKDKTFLNQLCDCIQRYGKEKEYEPKCYELILGALENPNIDDRLKHSSNAFFLLDKDDSDQLLDRIKQNEFFIALEKFNTFMNQFGKDASSPSNASAAPTVPTAPTTPAAPAVPAAPTTSDTSAVPTASHAPTAPHTPAVPHVSNTPAAPDTSDVPAAATLTIPTIPVISDTLIDLCEDRSYHEVNKKKISLKRQRKRVDYSIMDLQDVSENESSDDNFVEEPKRRKSQKQREKYRQQTASGRKALDVKRKLLKDTRKRS